MNENPKPSPLTIIPVTIHGPKGKAEAWLVVEGSRLSRKMRRAMGVK